ncbi:hypothetical protein [Streptomyces sp. Ru72]|uniref:hypothetical protein n=1 Tax=Streptomyces sp. Ru72 TaxID=2080747 RepID=UPI000CDDA62E|nr:hypothetical protein [Streptomyces sp. Ru72]POX45429.1 hypothetical protein C3488_29620 [Streptomyces sp. Ru72]
MVMFETGQRARRRYRDRTGGRTRRPGRDGLGGRAAFVAPAAVVVLLAAVALLARDPAFHDAVWTFVRSL